MNTNGTIRAFVTGWPVSHSLSPLLHGHWLKRYAIDGSYEAVAKAPEEISRFLTTLAETGWAGGNVTIPHKEVALRCCARTDGAAEAIGAVNTVWTEDGALVGSNTDGYGFAANLDDFAPGWDAGETALVLGAGGAARAVIHALLSRNFCRVVIVNRTAQRALALAGHFGEPTLGEGWDKLAAHLPAADLLVNTTSLGMAGGQPLEVDLAPLRDSAIVTDIVYTPLVTPLLRQARSRGLKTVDGLGMLLHQAVPGFERWFGRRPQVDDELRNALLAALEEREAGK